MFSTPLSTPCSQRPGTQLRTAAAWLLCVGLASSALASRNLVSGLGTDTQVSDQNSQLDPGSMGSANNPGKISQGPGDGPSDGPGDDHKRDGKADLPLLIGVERELGSSRSFTKDQDIIQPPYADNRVTMSGEMTFAGTVDHGVGQNTLAFGYAPVPAPGSLMVLGAAAGLGARRRRS